MRSLYAEPKNEVILGSLLRPVDVPCTPKKQCLKEKSKGSCTCKKTETKSWYINHVSTHEKKKQQDQHNEHNCNRPLTRIIIINIFEYLVLSATLYPLTSIIPYKKRLSSLQYSAFYKFYFMINLKISRIRPLFQIFFGDLISRISAVPIFRGIKFCWIGHKTRNPLNLIPTKQIQQRQQ